MNKARRKKLEIVFDTLLDLSDLIEEVKGEEEEVLDNIPENLQGTERYEQCEVAIDTLNEAMNYIESARDELEEIING